MTLEKAQDIAKQLWSFPVWLTRKGNACYVLRELTDDEKRIRESGTAEEREKIGKLQVTSTNRVILGNGPDWTTAMRFAAKPRIAELNAEKQKREDELRAAEREAQARLNLFADFLMQKHKAEFETWLGNGQSFEPKQTPDNSPSSDAGRPEVRPE